MTKVTILLFFISMASYSQSLEKLEERKEQLRNKIEVLQDSLNSVEKEIKRKEAKLESGDQEDLSVLSETLYLNVQKDTPLLSLPGDFGDTLTIMKKGARIQIIDENKDYYLACISDDCGYVLINNLSTKKKATNEEED